VISVQGKVKIGTRGSALALVQAGEVQAALKQAQPDLTVELEIIKTRGDKMQSVPLAQVGGKGLFVKEIEEALLEGWIDLAVHSMKDLPSEQPDGLIIAAVPERLDARDALVSLKAESLEALPAGARVGTSSLRRRAQLLSRRPDLLVAPLRGNVDTRLARLASGDLKAVVLAAAGLIRLGRLDHSAILFDPQEMLPAIGQGALGLEVRAGNEALVRLLARLHHPPTANAVLAERAFLRRLAGDCHVPVAAYAVIEGGMLRLEGLVSDPEGRSVFRDSVVGSAAGADALGETLAETLLGRGADRVLAALKEKR